MSALTDFFKKAQDAISNLRGNNNYFIGKNGDVVYSKNNVCVHEASKDDCGKEESVRHVPGYLTVHCQQDDDAGVTLVLQWLPNTTLQKNPASIRSVSPRGHDYSSSSTSSASSVVTSSTSTSISSVLARPPKRGQTNKQQSEQNDDASKSTSTTNTQEDMSLGTTESGVPPEISIEMNGDVITVTAVDESSATATATRPVTLATSDENGCIIVTEDGDGEESSRQGENGRGREGGCNGNEDSSGGSLLFLPSINVIPNTPIGDSRTFSDDEDDAAKTLNKRHSVSSQSTSGADDSDHEEDGGARSSSCDEDDDEAAGKNDTSAKSSPSSASIELLARYRSECSSLLRETPEQLAAAAGLALNEGGIDDGTEGREGAVAIARTRSAHLSRKGARGGAGGASLFSVNLGKMRSMRVFFSNPESTCGQIVIASRDSHYKIRPRQTRPAMIKIKILQILHFHHGGLDKLSQLFEHWSAIKAKSVNGSPSPCPDRQLLIWQPVVGRSELDPEDGLYDAVSTDLWRSFQNTEGTVDDSLTVRKAVYYASVDASLRKEIWPFLLRVYPWESTLEQREATRNDLFLEYQNVKRKRIKKSTTSLKAVWPEIENTVIKDVVRTDRRNPYFEGEDNPNTLTMRNILLNYAAAHPEINYIQGMSDLLAPLLSTIQDEAATYWCFVGLMQTTLFAAAPVVHEDLMELNLEYLRELLKLLLPDFFKYLTSLGGDALQLMFVHRWLLLNFKREFPEADAMHIWEACWARYRTPYFHLFICTAIVAVYGADVLTQRLPHDEILLYFSSLAMHMDQRVVLKKARGLVHDVAGRELLPCTLAGLLPDADEAAAAHWQTHRATPRRFVCARRHDGDELCPFSAG